MKTRSSSASPARFSVALGLFDYINPIFYAITVVTLALKLFSAMRLPTFLLFAAGALLSLVFGLTIPTVKLLVASAKCPSKCPSTSSPS